MKKTISFNSKFGWITAFEEKEKITIIEFSKTRNSGQSPILNDFKNDLINFFSRKTKKIKAPCKIEGNLMQKKVWNELKKIKFGKTKSYGAIAKKYKLSPRHVGKICAQNKIPLFIPCHRVIRSDGSMGGFSARGGISLKKKLLDFEKN